MTTNPYVAVTVDVADDCPMRCDLNNESVVHFTLGSLASADDVPLDLRFEPGALRKFVRLAGEMLAASDRNGGAR